MPMPDDDLMAVDTAVIEIVSLVAYGVVTVVMLYLAFRNLSDPLMAIVMVLLAITAAIGAGWSALSIREATRSIVAVAR